MLKPSVDSQNNKTLHEILSKKLGINLLRDQNHSETQI